MASTDPYELEGKVLEGRYSVEAAIAEGGFGVVYRGSHIELQKPVALKVLKVRDGVSEKVNATIYEQFVNEARTVARLRHPSIVQALDLGRTVMPSGAKAPWMALEWIEGQTLRQWLSANVPGPLGAKETLDLLRPAFEAIACAHENQVAHRDIKPANLMVVDAAGRRARQVLVMDFGIAKLMEDGEAAGAADTRTTSEFATYTKRYGAPEQALGRRSGPWTDVHALALIMVEVLTGDTAYRDEERHSDGILGLILDNERPTPRKLGMDVGAWEAVFQKALHRNPNERYRDAGEFLTALEATLPGREAKSVPVAAPVIAAPPASEPPPAVVPPASPAAPAIPATAFHATGLTGPVPYAQPNAATPPFAPVASAHISVPAPSARVASGPRAAVPSGSYAPTVVGASPGSLPTVVGPPASQYAPMYPTQRATNDSHTTSAPLTFASEAAAQRPASNGSRIGAILAGLGVVVLLGGVGYSLAMRRASNSATSQPTASEPLRATPPPAMVTPPPEIVPLPRAVTAVAAPQVVTATEVDAGAATPVSPQPQGEHHRHTHTQQPGFHVRVN